jgi:hypothetical protein
MGRWGLVGVMDDDWGLLTYVFVAGSVGSETLRWL